MKKISFSFILFFVVFLTYAQRDSTASRNSQYSWKFDKRRIFLGGGIGGTFGQFTAVNVSPVIGYRFTDQLAAGPRIIYNYYGQKGIGSFSNYGYGFMARYFPQPQFFLQGEYQELYVKTNVKERYRVPGMHVGAGYYNRPMVFYVLYDLLWVQNKSPQNSPVQVNFGLMF